MTLWTEKEDAILIDCIKKGLSFYQASLTLDRTRNACIGRAHRLEISLPQGIRADTFEQRIPAPRRVAKAAAPKPAKPNPGQFPRMANLLVLFEPKKPSQAFRSREKGEGVPVLKIKAGQCRWPLSAFAEATTHFCGEPSVEGHSWCAGHKALAYAPRSTRPPMSEEEKLKRKYAMLRHNAQSGGARV
jgi:GcrA cell cycle regulator